MDNIEHIRRCLEIAQRVLHPYLNSSVAIQLEKNDDGSLNGLISHSRKSQDDD